MQTTATGPGSLRPLHTWAAPPCAGRRIASDEDTEDAPQEEDSCRTSDEQQRNSQGCPLSFFSRGSPAETACRPATPLWNHEGAFPILERSTISFSFRRDLHDAAFARQLQRQGQARHSPATCPRDTCACSARRANALPAVPSTCLGSFFFRKPKNVTMRDLDSTSLFAGWPAPDAQPDCNLYL